MLQMLFFVFILELFTIIKAWFMSSCCDKQTCTTKSFFPSELNINYVCTSIEIK